MAENKYNDLEENLESTQITPYWDLIFPRYEIQIFGGGKIKRCTDVYDLTGDGPDSDSWEYLMYASDRD